MIAVQIASVWPASRGQAVALAAPMLRSARIDPPIRARWSAPVSIDDVTRGPWGVADRTDRVGVGAWGQYATLLHAAALPWGISTATDRATASHWGQYLHYLTADASAPWGISTATDRATASHWGQYLHYLTADASAPWGISTATDYACPSPWGKYLTRLNIDWTAPTEAGEGAVAIPVQRTYIVINDVVLTRVADDVELPAISLQLSIESDSWVWGFSASLPGSALDDVIGDAGAPVELAAMVNGTEFRLLAERVARSRSFGRSAVSISGRGIAAWLDAPYAGSSSMYSATAITAQQAAESALALPDVVSGWALDWQLTDWLLPAGVWSHQGSPISAINRIAAAAGGYVQSDPDAKILHILPRYPVAPWNWAGSTIDYEIPADVATTESIELTDKPDYDVVYISGEVGGVLGRVLRTGEAGSRPAQMVTDALITHADAARQRGLSILADTGRQTNISLSMPVLPVTGIILPGKMVQYNDGATTRTGLTRAVSVRFDRPTLRQTLEIESHE